MSTEVNCLADAGRRTPDGADKAENKDDNQGSARSLPGDAGAGGSSAYLGAGAEAVLDKLTMMEKRQESITADNNHQMQALKAQYDSLGERLGEIERILTSTVVTTGL